MDHFNTEKSNEKTSQAQQDKHLHHLSEIINESTVKIRGSKKVYVLKTKNENFNTKGLIRKCTFGNKNIQMRTIMMVGETGSGKSTHINSMLNYILGVKQEDDFRFEIINECINDKSPAKSQTTAITVYEINNRVSRKVPYSLTIIDTPGFGDTRGIEQDKHITETLHELFKSPQGIHIIDAVFFVVRASQTRLTPTQKYIFDSILSIFGKDIEKNIMIIVTFSDGKPPAALETINDAGIPCAKDKKGKPVHFKFNNSVLYSVCDSKKQSSKDTEDDDDDEDDETLEKCFWEIREKGMKKLFEAVEKMESKSLHLTQEVLNERKQLQACVEGLERQMNAALNKQEELKQTQQVLDINKDKMEANKNFSYAVAVSVIEKEKVSHTSHNCKKCEMTCHSHCSWAFVKKWCDVMEDSVCTVCPGKCSVNDHVREKAEYKETVKQEKRTYQDLKAKYEQASNHKMTAAMVLDELQHDLDKTEEDIQKLFEKSCECVRRLEEIALKPNPFSIAEYIHLLIQEQKNDRRPGFQERIKNLEKLKIQEEILKNINKKK